MDLDGMYQVIERACLEEGRSGALARFVSERAPRLHHAIKLETHSTRQLMVFASAYIRKLPVLVSEAWTYAESDACHWLKHALLTAQRIIKGRSHCVGMRTLLMRAYVSHRLLEEVNDRCIQQLGRSLLSLDMTRANLVAYELLGAACANHLDASVRVLAAQLEEGLLEAWPLQDEHTNVRQLEALRLRGCLSREAGVRFRWRMA